MKYSLIVSIYRVEKYLPQCIDSILAQTYPDFEVILVDDGSPDNCPQICDEYAAKDSRVKVIHKENGGLMSTRKVGASVATGEYLCFIDGDDFISADMLQTYEEVLAREDTDIICAGYSDYYADGYVRQRKQRIPCGIYHKKELVEKVYPQMLSVSPFFTFHVCPTVWSKCFKKEIAEKVYQDMPENISLGEDVVATYPALLIANSVCVADYDGYTYRQNPGSMTRTYDKRLYEKLKNLLVHLKKIEEEFNWDAGRQIDEYAVYLLYLARNNEFLYNKKNGYQSKKKKLLQYLKDELFSAAIKNVKMKSVKDKVILACFRHKLMLLLYLMCIKNRKKGCCIWRKQVSRKK